jgi:nitrile hydratase
MDSVHDIGGMQGFGAVEVEVDEPPFHAPWEGRVHGLMLASSLAVGGGLRPYIERMGSAAYLSTSYYEHWLAATEARVIARGAVTAAELAAKQAEIGAGAPVPEHRDPEAGAFVRSLFGPTDVAVHEGAPAPRFGPGDAVRVKRMHPAGHTRCPRYVRGARGAIALVHPAQPLPDLATRGETHVEAFYSVAFTPAELWGADAEPGATTIHVDLWESYLDEAAVR